VSLRARNPRAALATVVVEGFFGRLAFGMVSFGLPLYALSLGMSLAQIGILVSLRTIFVLPLKPVAGWLSDRVGVRAVYLSGALARTVAAALLLVAEGFVGLMLVRLLQGTSAAGRDVASLGVIVRDARNSVGSAYSWYASAKHVGGVAGAGIAGLLLSATENSFGTLFGVVLVLSVLPTIAAWAGLREVSDEDEQRDTEQAESGPAEGRRASGWLVAELSAVRELAGPASVGMLVAASAYMVHGLFPVLATEYAGLSDAQAGLIYSLSAAVFLVSGPAFGYIVDRRGRALGLAWRSAANVGSSFLYLLFPTFLGLAAARSVDDSGKAAFKPAWASAVAEISAADPGRRGKRLGALDTSQTLGEAIGPALAGLLWQSGGVFALFAVRVVIALAAEIAALRVFGEFKGLRPRPSARLTAASYVLPPALGLAAAAGWVGYASGWGASAPSPVSLAGAGGVVLVGVLGGALAGGAASAAERRAAREGVEQMLGDLAHDLRGPLTVIRGEVELVLGREDVGGGERGRSGAAVVDEVGRVEEIVRRRREGGEP
jgi:MFS family permease